MVPLELVIAPDPIFKAKADPVSVFDNALREIVEAMFDVLKREQGLGIGANMVGLTQRIIVIDAPDLAQGARLVLINPEITESSEETQEFEEASLSFPGIAASIRRPSHIKVSYQDTAGKPLELATEGFLATIIQHEMDYLEGRTFLDHLSPVKRKLLLKRYDKQRARAARG